MRLLTHATMMFIAMLFCPVAVVYIGLCALGGTISRVFTNTFRRKGSRV